MTRRALVCALAGLILLAGCAEGAGTADHVHPTGSTSWRGTPIPNGYPLPDETFTDTAGDTVVPARDVEAPVTLVFFGYTHCPDICQVVMAGIASALLRLEPSRRAEVDMVFVTTDPARDDEATLRSYLGRFDPSFSGATGRLDRIVRVATALGVPVEKGERLASGGYDVTHGTQILGLLPGGRTPFVWPEGTDPAALADDITTILDDKVPGL